MTFRSRKRLKMKLLYVLYVILCVTGLFYQIYLVLSDYFKYGVSTSIIVSHTHNYTLPSLTTCFRFSEIFNYDMFNQKYKSNFVFNYSDKGTAYLSGLEIQKLVTVDDVYQFTPAAHHMIDGCEIRNASNLKYHYYDSSICKDYFRVEKFIITQLTCYKMTIKSSSNIIYSKENAYFIPADLGFLFFVYFNHTAFEKFDIIVNVIHPSDNYPWVEFPLTQRRARVYNAITGKSVMNMFESKSNSIRIFKLLPPYETSCQDYRSENRETRYRDSQHCLLKCITDKVRIKFDRASLTNHYFRGVNMKLLSRNDISDPSFAAKYNDILFNCHELCPDNDCTYTLTYTNTVPVPYSAPGVFVALPDKPSFTIKYGEKVKFLETINFICSSLGIWFGFSFLAINPFHKIRTNNHRHKNNSPCKVNYNSEYDRIDEELLYLNIVVENLVKHNSKLMNQLIILKNFVYKRPRKNFI